MAITLDGITASVVDGVLDYEYTDSSSSTTSSGTDLDYDDFLQLLCAEMQYQDPLEPTSNTEYIAQLATFSQLEATLAMSDTVTEVGDKVTEMQESQEYSFASSLVGKEVVLLSDGTYITGQVDYVMYEDGEIMLCVNDGLYSLSTLDTIADEEYYEAVALSQTFAAMISALPDTDNLTTAYEGAISELRELYDGMTDYQKEFVSDSDLTTLTTVETYLAQLLEEEAEEISQSFADLIAALPDTEELTVDNADAVAEARELYDGMTDYQKTFVSEDDLTVLTDAEEYLAQLETAESET